MGVAPKNKPKGKEEAQKQLTLQKEKARKMDTQKQTFAEERRKQKQREIETTAKRNSGKGKKQLGEIALLPNKRKRYLRDR